MSQLATAVFWRDVAERAVGQAFQVLLPFLVLVSTTSKIDLEAGAAVAVVAGVQAVIVVLRSLTGLRVDSGAPVAAQIIDRAVAAAAASVLSLVTADRFDFITADWRSIGLSAASSIVVALGHRYISLPDPDATRPVR